MAELVLGNMLPENHVVVGYVVHLKVLDQDGNLYFAMRTQGLNDMEALGLASDMHDSIRADCQHGRERIE